MASETVIPWNRKNQLSENLSLRNGCHKMHSWLQAQRYRVQDTENSKCAIQTFHHNSTPWISSRVLSSLNFRWRRRHLSVLFFLLTLISFQSNNEVLGYVSNVRNGGKFSSAFRIAIGVLFWVHLIKDIFKLLNNLPLSVILKVEEGKSNRCPSTIVLNVCCLYVDYNKSLVQMMSLQLLCVTYTLQTNCSLVVWSNSIRNYIFIVPVYENGRYGSIIKTSINF